MGCGELIGRPQSLVESEETGLVREESKREIIRRISNGLYNEVDMSDNIDSLGIFAEIDSSVLVRKFVQ